jgi:hypothetical protein
VVRDQRRRGAQLLEPERGSAMNAEAAMWRLLLGERLLNERVPKAVQPILDAHDARGQRAIENAEGHRVLGIDQSRRGQRVERDRSEREAL